MTIRLRVAALSGWIALLGYGALKAHWALGGTIGVADTAEWDRMTDDLAPIAHFAAFWGTVMLDAAGALLLLALVRGYGSLRAQRFLRRLAWAGVAVLGTVAVLGLGSSLAEGLGALGSGGAGDGVLAPWVFVVVYGCFGVYAAALVVILRATSPARSDADVADRRAVSLPG